MEVKGDLYRTLNLSLALDVHIAKFGGTRPEPRPPFGTGTGVGFHRGMV